MASQQPLETPIIEITEITVFPYVSSLQKKHRLMDFELRGVREKE